MNRKIGNVTIRITATWPKCLPYSLLTDKLDYLREKLPRDDQRDILVDDGLDEGLQPLHKLILPKLEDVVQDLAELVGQVLVVAFKQDRSIVAFKISIGFIRYFAVNRIWLKQ